MGMQELVVTLARALVDHPDAVEVSEVSGNRGVILRLVVAPEDIGKVIGKDGRTAQAIRLVLQSAAMKADQRIQLEIVD